MALILEFGSRVHPALIMNGHDLYAYIKYVLTRLLTQKASRVEQLLLHHWLADLHKLYFPYAYAGDLIWLERMGILEIRAIALAKYPSTIVLNAEV